jgi:hypothetical protein
MATLVVTNLTTSPVYVADLYATIAASGSLTTTRPASALSAMTSLQSLIAAGTVSASVTFTATEQSSGLVGQGIVAQAATGVATEELVRVPLASGGSSGTADDVTVYALNKLPAAKMRILEVYAVISTAVGASTMQVRTQAAGAGTLCAQVSSATAGHAVQDNTVTASQVITNGASVGLFIRRSDRSVVGEMFIRLRPEI